SFFKIKPWKVILAGIVLGLLGMFYLKHVFATQKLWREVQQVEREYKQVKRLNNSYRLTYDRMIGPAEIYDKAKNKGFINGGPAENVIEIVKYLSDKQHSGILTRMFVVFGLVLLVPFAIGMQLFRINILDGNELQELWNEQAIDYISIPAKRGNIYDDSGKIGRAHV